METKPKAKALLDWTIMNGKTITVWQPEVTDATRAPLPLVYLNVFQGNGADVWNACRDLDCDPFTLVAVGGLDWNRELSPWPCEGTVRDAEPFAGEADAYLDEFLSATVPDAERKLATPPLWRGIAGYSLAGLFALWATTRCNAFSHIASISGSLWFPGFTDYLSSHAPSSELRGAYLSLGKKEHKTPNRMMRTVLDDTQAIEALLTQQGVATNFELNPGNHFADPAKRCARGIHWLLARDR